MRPVGDRDAPERQRHWVLVTRWLVPSLLLGGIALIGASFAPHENEVISNLIRELGIVLISVFGVSILYEIFIAQQHFETFVSALVRIFERGESNAAVCSRLGLDRIFSTRSDYLNQYPFPRLCEQTAPGSRMRIIGTSLYVIFFHEGALLQALNQGATIELGVLDPTVPEEVFEQIKHTVRLADLTAALERFEELRTKIVDAKPSGKIEVRAHRTALLNSFVEYAGTREQFAIWELSFGPDPGRKRVFLLDPAKPLGADLVGRYERIWKSAKTIFKYP